MQKNKFFHEMSKHHAKGAKSLLTSICLTGLVEIKTSKKAVKNFIANTLFSIYVTA